LNAGVIHCDKEFLDNVVYLVTNGVFKLLTGEAYLHFKSWQGHRNSGFRVCRKMLFRLDTVLFQLCQRWHGPRVGWIEALMGALGGVQHVGKYGVIEIGAAKPAQVFAVV
jgi:hypothetical protein